MLTIQRQYSLPNCVLILEGLNADGSSSPRPSLSTLTRFECHFGNESETIQGGRELLNLLAERVHGQAQSILSGIQSKSSPSQDAALTLRPADSGHYQLTISESLLQSAEPDSSDADLGKSLDLTLNSVQLFDLVEALDQLMEDQQTLPDLSLKLRPLSRKDAQSQSGVAQKFIPVGLGVVSLALVAAVSFVMPVPEITKPTAPSGETNSESVLETEPDAAQNDGTENASPPEEEPPAENNGADSPSDAPN